MAPGKAIYATFRLPEEYIVEEFAMIVREAYPKKEERPPLYLLIHSPGGLVNSAYVIATVLRETFDKIIAFIPHLAASGATLLAISCDEIIMGDISQLSPIDPIFTMKDEKGVERTVSALSIISAFRNLEEYFRTRRVEEAAYPYKHFTNSLSPWVFDEAVRSIDMVERYARELLEKAGYEKEKIETIITSLIHEATLHGEAIRWNKAQRFGLKVKHYREDPQYKKAWELMREWLRMYYHHPSLIHIIKYVLPKEVK
ncbi:MAG: hypothetical protein DRJ69_02250 [Thermoprotei archaeon]|nr:MAG: hypothetical protein DRJ69_02250 [Thermoprotei archaeon]